MSDYQTVAARVHSARALSSHDIVRGELLDALHKVTGRNVIAYYSGWLHKPPLPPLFTDITDADKNGLMSVIHGLDRSLGLDLILHTPGGDLGATESIIDYLRAMFQTDMRAIVPQLAMSGGTVIACACNEILMGKHSSLGPIDPQFQGVSAHAILSEVDTAIEETTNNPNSIPVWQTIMANYEPGLITACIRGMQWSQEIVAKCLRTGMFAHEPEEFADRIATNLADQQLSKAHHRHLAIDACRDLGLKVTALEEDQELQDAVLSVHHAMLLTLMETTASKIIENHTGRSIVLAPTVIINE